MKKILCVLAALVLCVVLVAVVNTDNTVSAATQEAYCQACGETKTWETLPSTSTWSTRPEGHYHYYLTESLSGSKAKYFLTPNPNTTAAATTDSGAKITVCLDLNGFSNTRDGRAIGIYTGNILNIMDNSEEQTGYIKSTSGGDNPVGGTAFVYGTLNLYSGTLIYENDGVGTNQTYSGGVMRVGSSTYKDAAFNMYGGKLVGGVMVTNANGSRGGTLYTEYGSVNLSGGEVISGSLPDGQNGPCVYLRYGTQLTLSGDARVANIYVDGSSAKVNITGVYSGKARLTYSSAPTAGKVIGTATAKTVDETTEAASLTGDLFCTNGNGWVASVSGENLVLSAYTESAEWHYCQHCEEVVRWRSYGSSSYKLPNTTAGYYHLYLAGTRAYYLQVGQSGGGLASTVCLDLYGNRLYRAGRAILCWPDGNLNLMDTKSGGVVEGQSGNDNERGGTISVSANGTVNMYSGTVKFTYSESATSNKTKRGVVAVGGTFNMYGGKISGGQMLANAAGGTVYVYNSTGLFNVCGGEVTEGDLSAGGVGPCVYVNEGGVKLSGDGTVDDIYYPTNTKGLTVSGNYTGTAAVTYGTAPELGAEVGVAENEAIVTGSLSCANNDYLITPQDGKLILVIDAPVVVTDGTTETAYETLKDAIDNCESGYVKLLQPITEDVTVSKNVTIDMNGKTITGTVTVDEGYTLTGMDNKTDDYTVEDAAGYGKLTADGKGKVVAADGYLRVNEDGALSFHKITVSIYSMSLRPNVAGLYYNSTFLGDEVVAEAVEQFGVALSVYETPNETNMDTKCEYSYFTNFEAGAGGNSSNSTLLKNVLKTSNAAMINRRNLQLMVHGRPYLKTADGYVFGKAHSRSLADQLLDVDAMFAELSGSQRYGLLEMYRTYEKNMSSLALTNVKEDLEKDTLKIFGIGNSYTMDLMWSLGQIYAAEYPEKNIQLGVAYISGGTVQSQASRYQNNQDLDKFYFLDTATATWSSYTITLKEAINFTDWDMVSLQQGSTSSVDPTTYDSNIQKLQGYVTEGLGYTPDFFWNQTWAWPIKPLGTKLETIEAQTEMYEKIVAAVQQKIVPDDTFKLIMPAGVAIQNANSVLEDADLYCDNVHLGAYGRLIVGYVMYAMIEDIAPEELTELKFTKTLADYSKIHGNETRGDVEHSEEQIAIALEAVRYALITGRAGTFAATDLTDIVTQ